MDSDQYCDGETGDEHIVIGPIGPIPIIHRIDPVVEAQGKADADTAGALHTPEELQGGMYHERVGVRVRVVPRLVARGFDHPATIPTLVDVLRNDPDGQPRFLVAMVLPRFGHDPRIVGALIHAMKSDPDNDVRAEAMSGLNELGLLDG